MYTLVWDWNPEIVSIYERKLFSELLLVKHLWVSFFKHTFPAAQGCVKHNYTLLAIETTIVHVGRDVHGVWDEKSFTLLYTF